ncbi:MAG: maltose acetyltransferase domain-containing protein [Burkholderiales bacterium]
MTGTELENMRNGRLYRPGAPEIQAAQAETMAWLARYNASLALPGAQRRALLAERLAFVGDGAAVRPLFHCNDGFNIRLGAGAFLNCNGVILDVVEVAIGDDRVIGAGSVVTRDVAPATTVVGNPARRIARRR